MAALFVVGTGGLVGAVIGQFVFGMQPCVLCLYQRIPYAIVAGLALLGLLLPLGSGIRRWLVAVAGVVFLFGSALAFYHAGVEWHWWGAITACGGAPLGEMSMEQFQAQLLSPQKPCDQVDWRVLGLSLAGWNSLGSLGLAVLCFVQTWRLGARRPL